MNAVERYTITVRYKELSDVSRRVRIFPIITIVACLTLTFLWASSKLETQIDDIGQQYQQAISTSNDLETEQGELKNTLASVNTDAFIENQARTIYDYMKPDEIRIVITNPEALYGTTQGQAVNGN